MNKQFFKISAKRIKITCKIQNVDFYMRYLAQESARSVKITRRIVLSLKDEPIETIADVRRDRPWRTMVSCGRETQTDYIPCKQQRISICGKNIHLLIRQHIADCYFSNRQKTEIYRNNGDFELSLTFGAPVAKILLARRSMNKY